MSPNAGQPMNFPTMPDIPTEEKIFISLCLHSSRLIYVHALFDEVQNKLWICKETWNTAVMSGDRREPDLCWCLFEDYLDSNLDRLPTMIAQGTSIVDDGDSIYYDGNADDPSQRRLNREKIIAVWKQTFRNLQARSPQPAGSSSV